MTLRRQARGIAIIAFGTALLHGGTLSAQVASITGPRRDRVAGDDRGVTERLAADLKALAAAQESYFASHQRYGRSLHRSGRSGVIVSPSAGVRLDLLYVTNRSWTARATHRALQRVSCVVYVGPVPKTRMPRTRGQRLAPTVEGMPICDTM
jgi:hypothetical protein